MNPLGARAQRHHRTYGPLLIGAVVLGLVGLPVAVWLDLRDLSERTLRNQASEISRIIDDMRGFYGSDVVGRVLDAPGPVTTTHNYRDVPGAIPIPATLSIELGKRISAHDGSVKYRFVSDLPFRGREEHHLDTFEQQALAALRRDPKQSIVEVTGSLLDRQVRAAAPVVMGPVCVAATTPIRTVPRPTGKSAMCAASRRFRWFSRLPPMCCRSNTCSSISPSRRWRA